VGIGSVDANLGVGVSVPLALGVGELVDVTDSSEVGEVVGEFVGVSVAAVVEEAVGSGPCADTGAVTKALNSNATINIALSANSFRGLFANMCSSYNPVCNQELAPDCFIFVLCSCGDIISHHKSIIFQLIENKLRLGNTQTV
jgi:hypothetical protein